MDTSHLTATTRDVVDAVAADVLVGLGTHLRVLELELDGPFADRGALVDGDLAVAGWRLRGIDDRAGFNGMWPTGKAVHVHGVTIVDRSVEPWRFHRHVDWNALNAQLGGSRGRTSGPLLVKRPEEATYLAALAYGSAELT